MLTIVDGRWSVVITLRHPQVIGFFIDINKLLTKLLMSLHRVYSSDFRGKIVFVCNSIYVKAQVIKSPSSVQ